MQSKIGQLFSANSLLTQAQIKPYAKAWREVTSQAIKNPGQTWVVLGDSMSQGIGASAYDKGWVGQASELLKAGGRSYEIVNLSSTGARVKDVLETQLPAMKALRLKPTLITVLVGSNDLVVPTRHKQLLASLTKLLDQLPPDTVIGDIFHRPQTPKLIRPLFSNDAASKLLASVAKTQKFTVVPLDDAFSPPWRGKLAPDRFHPNDKGYEGIAKAFADTITAN